jgi:hypothetical protein
VWLWSDQVKLNQQEKQDHRNWMWLPGLTLDDTVEFFNLVLHPR